MLPSPLTLERIKEQLRYLPFEGTFTAGLSNAAVLVCICPPRVNTADGPLLLLTKRTHSVETHKGQISFPGGGCESIDRTPIMTALREAEEEIGLSRKFVNIIGCLPALDTPTGFSILPVIGFIKDGFTLSINADEVADLFFVPLSFFMDRANTKIKSVIHNGIQRRGIVFIWQGLEIWGATALIIEQLCRRMGKQEEFVD